MGAAPQIQPQPFGKYYLLEKIATGGMAEIWKAKYRADAGIEKTLVIKKILPHLVHDEEFVTMFRDEAALTVRLNHANIVQVFDFGRNGEDYFLAMEYVQGQNLRAVMRRCQELGAPVPIPFALFAASEIAKGLSYAHGRRDESDRAMQIVHRDITPSNILVSYEGEFKIADFGIAKAASRAGGTRAGMIKGKASYLAPEQIQGTTVDARADLFSLGAVLWELVVGRKLFTGDTEYEIMNKVLSERIPSPSERNSAIPPAVDVLVMACLERDPAKRYSNASALQKDLTGLQGRFSGGVTSVDIGNFLRRLFKKEMEAEKEASKSIARAIIAPSVIHSEREDGGTLAAPAKRRTRELAPTQSGPMPAPRKGGARVAAVFAFVVLLGAGAAFGRKFVRTAADDGGMTTPTPGASSTPAPTETIASISPTPVSSTTAPPATPTPRPTRLAQASPRPTARVITTQGPIPTATPPSETPSAMGLLKLDSDPWGEIFVDGKDTGRQTPAFDLKLPEGRHEIRLVNNVQKLELTFTVEVSAATPQKKVVKLLPAN